MPNKAPHPCNHPGCGAITHKRFCDRHAKAERKRQDAKRGTSAQRGYGARWRKARAYFLSQNPLCIECQRRGRLIAATVVDHVIPHRGDYRLMWDPDNWAALCASCHSRKTAREDGGYGNRRGAW